MLGEPPAFLGHAGDNPLGHALGVARGHLPLHQLEDRLFVCLSAQEVPIQRAVEEGGGPIRPSTTGAGAGEDEFVLGTEAHADRKGGKV